MQSKHPLLQKCIKQIESLPNLQVKVEAVPYINDNFLADGKLIIQDDNRVYEELDHELAEGSIEYTDAAIYLLGSDIKRTFQNKTLSQIEIILDRLIQKLWLEDGLIRRIEILKNSMKI